MTAQGLPATTSVAEWTRALRHVEANVRSGRYVNAETTLLVAGPPRVSDIGGLNNADTFAARNFQGGTNSDVLGVTGRDALYPIGMVEQVGVQQAQNVQKMFEIGSRRSYQAGGRVQVVGNLGRVLFSGPSLLRVLYAYYPNVIQMANGQRIGPGQDQDSVSRTIVGAGDAVSQVFPPILFEPGSKAGVDPESGDSLADSFMINLMSELFSHPFGLGVILRNNRDQNYGGWYMEDCMVTTHGLNISSTSTLITEAVSFQADACVPMEFSTGDQGAGPQIQRLGA